MMKRAVFALAVFISGCPGGEEPLCGDAIVDAPEACDDGNDIETDECLSTCVLASCGDGILQSGVEACDDGNDIDTDQCLSSCELASCGDSSTQAGVEACDDGNNVETDECLSTCVLASCGDGILQSGVEACDDGGTLNGDGCNDVCQLELCGDSVINNNDEECDDGNAVDGDGCDTTCINTGCESGVLTADELCYGDVDVISVGGSPQGVAIADFNGDGHLDVVASSLSETVFVLFGDGTGALTPQPSLTAAADFTSDVATADFNEDGAVDIAVISTGSSNTGKLNIFLNDGSGGFGAPTSFDTQFFTRSFAIEDFNGDGDLDIFTAAQNSGLFHRFFGDGLGGFVEGAPINIGSPLGFSAGDVNGDGAVDVMVIQLGLAGISLFINADDGTGDFLAPVVLPLDGVVKDSELIDINGDTQLDLVVTVGGDPDEVTFFSNNGAAFSVVGSVPVSGDSTTLAIRDFNGDGTLDFAQLDFLASSYFVSSGEGGFSFGAPVVFPAVFPAQFVVGDLNEDGLQDFVLANQNGELRVSLFVP